MFTTMRVWPASQNKIEFRSGQYNVKNEKKGILTCSKLANLIGFLMVRKELGLGINMEVEKKIWRGLICRSK